MRTLKQIIRTGWPYGCLFAILFWFYFDIFIARGAWLVADHAEQHYPWAHYLAQSLKAGYFPFWTDQIHAGFPVTAEGQIGSFYLPNLILYYFLPIEQGFAWGIVLHLLLSAFLMFYFIRTLGVSQIAALFGTFVYLFGSTLGGAYYNITCLKVMTWFPLILIGIDRIFQTNKMKWKWIFVIGVLFALQLLVGYLQYASYAILFAFIYAFFRLFDHPQKWIGQGFRILGHLVPSVFIAALLALPQLWLTYELAIQSNRAVTEEGFAYVGSYSPFALICLLFPSMEGLFVSKLYLGILPLFFIFLALFLFKRISNRAIYWITLVAVLLALGRFSPLYVGIVKLFNFYSFRTPVKFIFFAGFFLTVLMAMAYDYWLRSDAKESVRRAVKTFWAVMISAMGAVFLGHWIFHAFEKQLFELGEILVRRFIFGTPGHPFDWPHYQKRIQEFIDYAQFVFQPAGKVVLMQLWKILAAAFFLFIVLRKTMPIWFIHAMAFVLIIWDLNFAYSDIRGDYAHYADYYRKTELTQYLEKNLDGHRYFIFSDQVSDAPLPAAKNMVNDLKTANAYSPLIVKDYYDFMGHLGGVNDSTGTLKVSLEALSEYGYKLDWLDVRYLISNLEIDSSKWKAVFSEGAWKIYENTSRYERVWLSSDWVIAENLTDVSPENDFPTDPFEAVVLKSHPIFEGETGESEENKIEILEDQEEGMKLAVHSQGNQMLVISRLYYPGWTAMVDGRQVAPVEANDVFLAVPVTAGVHQIELQYEPFLKFKKKAF